MPEQFQGFGIKLLYPDSWNCEEEMEGQSVSIESPEGAFLCITRFANVEDQTSALGRALQTMQDEYDEVEREALTREFAEFQLSGMLLRFVYLDLIIASQLLAFSHAGHTYLIQIQAEDRDHDRLGPVFDAIVTSMCQSLRG